MIQDSKDSYWHITSTKNSGYYTDSIGRKIPSSRTRVQINSKPTEMKLKPVVPCVALQGAFERTFSLVSPKYRAREAYRAIIADEKDVSFEIQRILSFINIKDCNDLLKEAGKLHKCKLKLFAQNGLITRIMDAVLLYRGVFLTRDRASDASMILTNQYKEFCNSIDNALIERAIIPMSGLIKDSLDENEFIDQLKAVYYLVLNNAFNSDVMEAPLINLINFSFDKISIRLIHCENEVINKLEEWKASITSKSSAKDRAKKFIKFLKKNQNYRNTLKQADSFIEEIQDHKPFDDRERGPLLLIESNIISQLKMPIDVSIRAIIQAFEEMLIFLDDEVKGIEKIISTFSQSKNERNLSIEDLSVSIGKYNEASQALMSVLREKSTVLNGQTESFKMQRTEMLNKMIPLLKEVYPSYSDEKCAKLAQEIQIDQTKSEILKYYIKNRDNLSFEIAKIETNPEPVLQKEIEDLAREIEKNSEKIFQLKSLREQLEIEQEEAPESSIIEEFNLELKRIKQQMQVLGKNILILEGKLTPSDNVVEESEDGEKEKGID